MDRLLEIIGVLVGGAAIIAAVLLINAGYVYRTECPREGGTVETEWSYQWQSIIPYFGYDRSGCDTHTATRVLLDTVGVWGLKESAMTAREDHRSEYTRSEIDGIAERCEASGQSASSCRCIANELATRIAHSDLTRYAAAIQGGAQRYEDLPADLAADLRAVSDVVERDC